jgi:hypothetical protein
LPVRLGLRHEAILGFCPAAMLSRYSGLVVATLLP